MCDNGQEVQGAEQSRGVERQLIAVAHSMHLRHQHRHEDPKSFTLSFHSGGSNESGHDKRSAAVHITVETVRKWQWSVVQQLS